MAIRDFLATAKGKAAVAASAGTSVFALPAVAFAADGESLETMGTSMTTIQSSMTSAFTTLANNCMSAIGAILPVVLPVMGAVVVIGIGVKIFKRFAH